MKTYLVALVFYLFVLTQGSVSQNKNIFEEFLKDKCYPGEESPIDEPLLQCNIEKYCIVSFEAPPSVLKFAANLIFFSLHQLLALKMV